MEKFKVSRYKKGDIFFCSFLKVGGTDNYGNVEYHFSIGPENLENIWSIKGEDQRGEILSRMPAGTAFSIELKDTGKAYPYATIITSEEGAPTTQAPAPAVAPSPSPTPKEDPDWNKIAEGKTRHGISCAFIQAGTKKLTPATAVDIDEWVEFIMKK